MKRILTIEFEIPGQSEINVSYSSNKSLLDSDLVVFRPRTNSYTSDWYDGKPKYGESSSRYFREAVTHWTSEIKDYLSAGKTLFVLLDRVEEFFILTGDKQYSGTGRSRQTINIVNQQSNYSLIGRSSSVKASEGDTLKCTHGVFKDFYTDFKEFLEYKAYIKSEKVESAFSTLHGNRVLGGIEKLGKGNIVYLPYIDFEGEDFIEEHDDGKEYWTDKAVQLGNRFVQHIIGIENQILGRTSKSIQPEWIKDSKYQLNSAQKIKNDIRSLDDKIKGLNEEGDKLRVQLDKELQLTDLLYETGKPLEHAVTKGLQILGFQAENYDDGELELDQVITSPEKIRYIGECEGKDNKAIDISKLRQLADAINEDFEKQDVEEEAFGLLFGNPQRLIEPKDRTESFTDKCISAAERRNIGLILTSDLFTVCQYLNRKKDSKFQKKCREAIRKGLGSKIDFPEIPKTDS